MNKVVSKFNHHYVMINATQALKPGVNVKARTMPVSKCYGKTLSEDGRNCEFC